MLRLVDSRLPGGTQLPPLYSAACHMHTKARGQIQPDVYWRAAYCCLTVTPELWERAKVFLSVEKQEWNLLALYHSGLSHGERIMVQLAAHLFGNALPAPDLNDLCNVLSPDWFATALMAVVIRRGE